MFSSHFPLRRLLGHFSVMVFLGLGVEERGSYDYSMTNRKSSSPLHRCPSVATPCVTFPPVIFHGYPFNTVLVSHFGCLFFPAYFEAFL